MTLRKLLSIVALALAALGPVHAGEYITLGAQAGLAYPGYGPYNAVDRNGNTIWTSGTFAPASIDVLMPGEYQVETVLLNAAMWPKMEPVRTGA